MKNLSKFSDIETASTQDIIANKRAKNLSNFGRKSVLELCVGPSLRVLEQAYINNNISVTGNDIENRWKSFYPKGKWIIGDCFNIDWSNFDAIVFAPPLSKNCSGKREDALMIDEIIPSYYDFIEKIKLQPTNVIATLVLPARSLATRYDRIQYFKLINFLYQQKYNVKSIEMKDSKNIRKYVDVYINKE